jgi:1-acyl-sn-glycerol-3-phosphate acyltransferase
MGINKCVFYERVKKPTKFCFDKLFCPKYVGLNNIPKAPYILAGNHTSMLDIPLLMCGLDDQINFMAKEELFKQKLIARFLEKMNAFPVKRGKMDLAAVRHAALVLKDGGVLGIFPEGTRNKGRELLQFQGGTEAIAKMADVPVVPFGISGEYKLRGNVTLAIGEPLTPEVLKQDPELLRNKVKELIRR